MASSSTSRFLALGVLVLGAVVQLALLSRWDLLADEAYYAAWALHPALGYFDQPPLVAWVLWGVRSIGDIDLLVRLPAVLAGVVGGAVLLPHVRDPLLLAGWWVGLPNLCWLTGFCTPDAFLLAAWSVVLACVASGVWWGAGVALAVALHAKYSAVLLVPLLAMATRGLPVRPRALALGLAGVLCIPHLAWLATNGAVSVGFQLAEGWGSPDPPGVFGPLLAVGQQLLVATPLGVLAAAAVVRRPRTPIERLAIWTSLPVFVFFVVSAAFGWPEGHWMAPAWVGVGLFVASDPPAWGRRAAWMAVGLGAGATLLAALHVETGLVPLRLDPADRLREGRPMAYAVGAWALPLGVGPREPRAAESVPVYTERYQEAALIAWYTGIPAVALAGCARADQYDLWPQPLIPDEAVFVRPSTSGDAICADEHGDFEATRHAMAPRDAAGRVVGRWDLFELRRVGAEP
jgi:hypothetical protein